MNRYIVTAGYIIKNKLVVRYVGRNMKDGSFCINDTPVSACVFSYASALKFANNPPATLPYCYCGYTLQEVN